MSLSRVSKISEAKPGSRNPASPEHVQIHVGLDRFSPPSQEVRTVRGPLEGTRGEGMVAESPRSEAKSEPLSSLRGRQEAQVVPVEV